MNSVSIVSVVGGLSVAALSVILTHLLNRRHERLQRIGQQQDLMSRYRDPLLWAAYDLQSRLYNIAYGFSLGQERAKQCFVGAFLVDGSQWHKDYARTSTAFVFAEYLCWTEILRRDVGFLDLGRRRLNRRVMDQLWTIGEQFNLGLSLKSDVFRVFHCEQRAIGELLIASGDGAERFRCIGYAAFCAKLRDAGFRSHLERLLSDIDGLPTYSREQVLRIVLLQNALIDLVDLLDPDMLRFPARRRTKISSAAWSTAL